MNWWRSLGSDTVWMGHVCYPCSLAAWLAPWDCFSVIERCEAWLPEPRGFFHFILIQLSDHLGADSISGDGLELIISYQLITLCMPAYRPQCSDFLFFREKCRFKQKNWLWKSCVCGVEDGSLTQGSWLVQCAGIHMNSAQIVPFS